jgi:outer membrane protein assembly factor BamE
MDSPQRTERWHGQDRWTYIFYDKDTRLEKEVHFQEGVANYVGEIYKPEISAEEQGAHNEAANKEVEAYIQTHQQEIRTNFQSYEQHVHGQDTIRYVPQFTPVQ